MRRKSKTGLSARLLETALRAGFRKAYDTVRVNPDQYLAHLKRVHRLPVASWKDMLRVDERTLNPLAARVISASTKTAALEGMGLGLGGFVTLLPDMGILSAITIRMLQKLSLIYGFEYTTAEDETELWLANRAANHRPHCGEGRYGSRGEMVRSRDSGAQRGSGRHAELLFRALLGTPRAKTFSRAPSRGTHTYCVASSCTARRTGAHLPPTALARLR
jgi:hypothetical protein